MVRRFQRLVRSWTNSVSHGTCNFDPLRLFRHHDLPPRFLLSPQRRLLAASRPPFQSSGPRRRFRKVTYQAEPNPVEAQSQTPPVNEENVKSDSVKVNNQTTDVPQETDSVNYPNKEINRRIALTSTVGAIGFFLSRRLEFGVSLKDLVAASVPYEKALSNGRSTVLEFYADWCEVCRELAPDIYQVEQKYKDTVNFVMLNVDNTRWEQELDEFGVEGIPHFAFLDKDGNEEGNIVGRLPRQYFLENVVALANGEPTVPHARVVGLYTSAESRKVHQAVDLRSHG